MTCPGCDVYDERINRVTAPEVFMQTTRPYAMKPFPKKYVFTHCPWCGTELEEK